MLVGASGTGIYFLAKNQEKENEYIQKSKETLSTMISNDLSKNGVDLKNNEEVVFTYIKKDMTEYEIGKNLRNSMVFYGMTSLKDGTVDNSFVPQSFRLEYKLKSGDFRCPTYEAFYNKLSDLECYSTLIDSSKAIDLGINSEEKNSKFCEFLGSVDSSARLLQEKIDVPSYYVPLYNDLVLNDKD
jgi:hypothetical protein